MVSLDLTVQKNVTVVIIVTATEQAASVRHLNVYLDGGACLAVKVCLINSIFIRSDSQLLKILPVEKVPHIMRYCHLFYKTYVLY